MDLMFKLSDLQEFQALDPIISKDCTTLVLVSMPSEVSHQENFYFADPANRFWVLMEILFHMPTATRQEKLELLAVHHIGIWSVIRSCLRYKSREDTMEDIVVNDMQSFLARYPQINRIVCVSHDTMRLLQEADPQAALMAAYVPSPSTDDLWYDSVDQLIPEYAKAFGVVQ